MKKLLLLACILITGCTDYVKDNVSIVVGIALNPTPECRYKVTVQEPIKKAGDAPNAIAYVLTNQFFNIGDTIKLCK